MKIRQIAIHNFRSILDASFEVHDFTLLVGANNAGKSTVIDAIRCFYEKDISFKKDRDFPCVKPQKDFESWVEIRFHLGDDDLEDLGPKYKSDDRILSLRKYFESSGRLKSGIHALDKNGKPSSELFYGPKNIPEGKLGTVTFIPAVGTVEEFTKLSGPSDLQELVLDVLGDVIHGDETERLNQSISAFFDSIRKESGANRRFSLESVEERINEELEKWGSEIRFSLANPTIKEMVKNQLRFVLKDHWSDVPQEAKQFGSGFQRHLVYSILKVRAQLMSRMPTPQSATRKLFNSEQKILLFEEPEAFLHPDQQELLFRNLKELAKKGFQVICTSHSPKFLSLNFDEISSLVRIGKENGIATAHQINDDERKTFFSQTMNCPSGTLPDLQMASIKYCLLMNPQRAEAMFAERVLLVEGPSETALINALVNRGDLSVPFGMVVIDTLGKFNMPRFMFLLQKLGIPHVVIIDKDESNEQQGWNKFIERRKQSLTRHIEYLDPDLERVVGLPKNCGLPARLKHQKPQQLLWLLERNQIPNISQFLSHLEDAFSKLGKDQGKDR